MELMAIKRKMTLSKYLELMTRMHYRLILLSRVKWFRLFSQYTDFNCNIVFFSSTIASCSLLNFLSGGFSGITLLEAPSMTNPDLMMPEVIKSFLWSSILNLTVYFIFLPMPGENCCSALSSLYLMDMTFLRDGNSEIYYWSRPYDIWVLSSSERTLFWFSSNISIS